MEEKITFGPQTLEEYKITFAVSCIESAADKVGCSAKEMYIRMKSVGLVEDYILKFYDTLHTESRKNITEDVLKTLTAWEKWHEDQIMKKQ